MQIVWAGMNAAEQNVVVIWLLITFCLGILIGSR